MKNLKNKKGFTIVELVIVIAVIAILAAVLIPTFSGVIEKANKSAVQQEAAALYKNAYAMDLSDGVLDGKEAPATENISSVEGKTVTYSASQSGNAITVSFSYNNTTKGYTASFDGSVWTVTKNA